jgi:hypothetical protein
LQNNQSLEFIALLYGHYEINYICHIEVSEISRACCLENPASGGASRISPERGARLEQESSGRPPPKFQIKVPFAEL